MPTLSIYPTAYRTANRSTSCVFSKATRVSSDTSSADCDDLFAALDERGQVGHDEHAADAADGKV